MRSENLWTAGHAIHHGYAQNDLQILLLPVPWKLPDCRGKVFRIAEEFTRRHGAVLRDAGSDNYRPVGGRIENARNDGVIVGDIPVRPGPREFPAPILRILAVKNHVGLVSAVLAEGV